MKEINRKTPKLPLEYSFGKAVKIYKARAFFFAQWTTMVFFVSWAIAISYSLLKTVVLDINFLINIFKILFSVTVLLIAFVLPLSFTKGLRKNRNTKQIIKIMRTAKISGLFLPQLFHHSLEISRQEKNHQELQKELQETTAVIRNMLEELTLEESAIQSLTQKAAVAETAIRYINDNPKLRKRIIKVIRREGIDAFVKEVNHPIGKILGIEMEAFKSQ